MTAVAVQFSPSSPACNYRAQLDLTALVAAGHGDVPLVQLPLHCAACGAVGHRVFVSGQSMAWAKAR
jgi:hypothetical protein